MDLSLCSTCLGKKLKNIDQSVKDFVVPASSISPGDYMSITSDVKLHSYAQSLVSTVCNTALHTVYNSWDRRTNSFNLNLRDSTIGGSSIYCLKAVSTSDKNSGAYDTCEKLQRWYEQTHDRHNCILPNAWHLVTPNPLGAQRIVETFADFLTNPHVVKTLQDERHPEFIKLTRSDFPDCGKEARRPGTTMHISANGGLQSVPIMDFIRNPQIPMEPYPSAYCWHEDNKVEPKPGPATETSDPAQILSAAGLDVAAICSAIQKNVVESIQPLLARRKSSSLDQTGNIVNGSVRKALSMGGLGSPAPDTQSTPTKTQTLSVSGAFSDMTHKHVLSDESVLTGNSGINARKKLTELLSWSHKINAEIPTVSISTTGKRSWSDMADTPGDRNYTGQIYHVLQSNDTMSADAIKDICEILCIKYPQQRDYKGSQTPKQMAMMSIALMANHFFSTNEAKVPNLE